MPDQLAQAERVAAHRGGLHVQFQAHLLARGHRREALQRVGRLLGQVGVAELQLQRVRVAARQEQQLLDQRAHAGDLGLDVAERLLLRGRVRRARRKRAQVAADHGQRRAQLVARVGRELALAADRLADGHQGAAGVEPPDRGGQRDGGQAGQPQHGDRHLERAELVGPVGHHLEHVDTQARLDRLGQHPLRRPSMTVSVTVVEPVRAAWAPRGVVDVGRRTEIQARGMTTATVPANWPPTTSPSDPGSGAIERSRGPRGPRPPVARSATSTSALARSRSCASPALESCCAMAA